MTSSLIQKLLRSLSARAEELRSKKSIKPSVKEDRRLDHIDVLIQLAREAEPLMPLQNSRPESLR